MKSAADVIGVEIPYYGIMKGTMEKQLKVQGKQAHRRGTPERMTEKAEGGEIRMINGCTQQGAVEKLFRYEELGISPYQVSVMKERNAALEKRIRQLEEY